MKIDKKNTIFLLGGYDLEMVEIKRVLLQKKIEFFYENLSWGAKLSAYKKRLNKFMTYYAVELDMDLKGYDNVKVIDHHGAEHNHKDASLLQILKLLNITPTRDQKLIAANDARYIEGMKCLKATDAEIEDIRRRDREAQNIILHDEIVAKSDVQKRVLRKYISIIYAHTPRF